MDLSTAILTLSENGDLQRIHDNWLNTGTCDSQNNGVGGAERLSLRNFGGLFLICGVACVIALLIHFVRILFQFCQYRRHGAADGAQEEDENDGDDDGDGDGDGDKEKSQRRPARQTSIRDLMSFVDMEEAEVKRAIRSRSGKSMGRSRSDTSDAPSSSPV